MCPNYTLLAYGQEGAKFWMAPAKCLSLYRFGILSDSAYPETVKTIYSACHKTLINLIKAERQRAGIRQAVLAKQMKKQQNWISRLEKGDRRVDVCQFLQLADLIGLDAVEALRTVNAARNKRNRSK